MSLSKTVADVLDQLEVSDAYVDKLGHEFVAQASAGLKENTKRGVPMIPTFLTKVPTGLETGTYLAADLGGSNFRVCSVKLNGDKTHEMQQMKWPVPHEIMVGTAASFWGFLAECVAKGVHEFHTGACDNDDPEHRLRLGFTFSFPTHQTHINHGTLMRWTKGYDIDEAVGTDVCDELQKALDARNVPVHVTALCNDTTGCLVARAYETGPTAQTLAGLIAGTGTNLAYSEKTKLIEKLDQYDGGRSYYTSESNIMVVNTEWGSFDNDLKVLPVTKWDKEIDLRTPNPEYHMFEKRVSGMYLGEIVRSILEDLVRSDKIFAEAKPQISQTSRFYTPWSSDTSLVSNCARDSSESLEQVEAELQKLGIPVSSVEERKATKAISEAVSKRSARLVGALVGGMTIMTKAFDMFETVDIGADGSVLEFCPGYEQQIIDAISCFPEIKEKISRLQIGISKDGSGIGAALCAAMAPEITIS